MYDRTTVQGATFNMRGQLYRGHANATALSSSPVVSALGSESDDPGSSPGRGKALCPWDVRKKNASSKFRLGLIYMLDRIGLHSVLLPLLIIILLYFTFVERPLEMQMSFFKTCHDL